MSPVPLPLPNSMQLHLHPNTVTSPYFTETGGRWIGLRIFVTGALMDCIQKCKRVIIKN